MSLINSFEQRIFAQEKMQLSEGNDRTYLDYLIHEQIFKRNSTFTGILEKVIKIAFRQQDVTQLMQQKEIGSFLSLYYTLQRFMTDYSVLIDNQIRMQKMLDFIYKHYSEPLSLKDLARAANVSRSEVGRCFMAFMNRSARE